MDAMSQGIKTVAHQLIDSLPSGATWDDLMYRVYVRQCVDTGLDDAKCDRVLDVEEVRRRFGLKP